MGKLKSEKKVILKKDSLFLVFGDKRLEISFEELRARRGVHKTVINKVAPWIERALNEV